MALLLLIQLGVFVLFTVTLQNYLKYYLGISVLISALFLFYLVNQPGKNEFKIAWILPVLIIPVFGISLFFMYRYNQGGFLLKQKLQNVKKHSERFITDYDKQLQIWEGNPDVKDLCNYLYNKGPYPAFTGCKTKYFSCGEDFFEDVLNEFSKAKKFIFLEFFIVEPCQLMDKLLSILNQKVKEGIEVRILFDSIGSISLSSSLLKNYFSSFGINSKIWLKFIPVFNTGLNNRDHRKIICIDGTTAYTGGVNLTDEYANIRSNRFEYWKDAGIKIYGNASQSFTKMFLEQWNVQNRKNQPYENFDNYINKSLQILKNDRSKREGIVIPYGDDAYNDVEIAEDVYRYLLMKASKKICVMTPYVIIDHTMLEDLVFAANRGVQVEIIVPKHYDHFVSFCVGRTYIKNLIANKIKVYEYNPGFIHSKVFLSDDDFGTVGSINLDYRSFYHHFECGTFLYKAEALKKAHKDFENTKKECTLITDEYFKTFPWYMKLTGFVFRIFGPLM